jgi:hypothetical protein
MGAVRTRLEFDYKLDISVWWHTRQLIRKDIWILAHYWNFIKGGDNGHIVSHPAQFGWPMSGP